MQNPLMNGLIPIGVRLRCYRFDKRQKRRRELLERVANGEIDILIGTHALIQPDVI